jgi:hypothetical protein
MSLLVGLNAIPTGPSKLPELAIVATTLLVEFITEKND